MLTLGDVDSDGSLDVVIGVTTKEGRGEVWALSAENGLPLPNFPVQLMNRQVADFKWIPRLVVWSVGWSTHSVVDGLAFWLVYSLVGWFVCLLLGCLLCQVDHWSICWLILTGWLADCFALIWWVDWMVDFCLTDWLAGWLADWPIGVSLADVRSWQKHINTGLLSDFSAVPSHPEENPRRSLRVTRWRDFFFGPMDGVGRPSLVNLVNEVGRYASSCLAAACKQGVHTRSNEHLSTGPFYQSADEVGWV